MSFFFFNEILFLMTDKPAGFKISRGFLLYNFRNKSSNGGYGFWMTGENDFNWKDRFSYIHDDMI